MRLYSFESSILSLLFLYCKLTLTRTISFYLKCSFTGNLRLPFIILLLPAFISGHTILLQNSSNYPKLMLTWFSGPFYSYMVNYFHEKITWLYLGLEFAWSYVFNLRLLPYHKSFAFISNTIVKFSFKNKISSTNDNLIQIMELNVSIYIEYYSTLQKAELGNFKVAKFQLPQVKHFLQSKMPVTIEKQTSFAQSMKSWHIPPKSLWFCLS